MTTSENDLQLERAEFDKPETRSSCAMCSRPLERRYFQVNGQSVCTICCGRVKASLDSGTPLKRGLLALAAGGGAALVGAVLYYAILALTGYEFALIAIVVGLLVGKAVSWGSAARGGWLYQTMAIALTYLSIVSAYVPLLVAEIRKANVSVEHRQLPTEQAVPVVAVAADAPTAAADAPAVAVSNPAPDPGPAPDVPIEKISLGRALFAVALLVGFVLAAPFLGGLSNIIGLVIIAIGLHQAWKMNRRREVVITGPHAIASPVVAAPAAVAAAPAL